MRLLSVVHGPEARAELFEPVVVAAGHAIDEWSFSWGRKPPRPLESYDAYMVFGGAIHPDQEAQHTWMPQEIDWLEGILADRRPVLGRAVPSGSDGAPARPLDRGLRRPAARSRRAARRDARAHRRVERARAHALRGVPRRRCARARESCLAFQRQLGVARPFVP